MVALEESGILGPRVLDIGCGRGALSIYLAEKGHEVLGVDRAEEAIASARKAAAEKDIDAVFVTADAIEVMGQIHDSFDAVVDVGFFHALGDDVRPRFESQLARVLAPGGVYAMLAFSDRVPGVRSPPSEPCRDPRDVRRKPVARSRASPRRVAQRDAADADRRREPCGHRTGVGPTSR
jgi:SAM-dependent methyltransferase